MGHKYLSLANFAYNIFNSPNLCHDSPYELILGRRPKILLDLETNQDIKVSGAYKEYNSGDLVYIICPLTSHLRTTSRKVAIKYVGPLVIYKIVDPHNYLLMTLDGKLLQGLFEHERLKPMIIKTDKGNLTNLVALQRVMNLGLV